MGSALARARVKHGSPCRPERNPRSSAKRIIHYEVVVGPRADTLPAAAASPLEPAAPPPIRQAGPVAVARIRVRRSLGLRPDERYVTVSHCQTLDAYQLRPLFLSVDGKGCLRRSAASTPNTWAKLSTTSILAA